MTQPQRLQSSYMEFEFGQLHYCHINSGKKTTLLLLHAFHSSAASYETLCELLKDQYNLICLDLPGHGLSCHVDCQQYAWYYSMAGFTAVVTEFIQRLQLSNYYIVGDSVGGNCAVRAMASLSGLSGIVLMGSVQARTVEMVFSLHHQTQALKLLFKKHRTQTEDQIVAEAYVNRQLKQGENLQRMLHDIQNTDANCREYFSKQMQDQEWEDELALIQHTSFPLMYILGEDDGFINSVKYKKTLVEARLKESKIHLLKGVRHIPQLDAPQITADLISRFVKKNEENIASSVNKMKNSH